MTPRNISGGQASIPAAPEGRRWSFQVDQLTYARLLHPKGGTGQVAFGGPKPGRKLGPDGKPVFTWTDQRWSPHSLATRTPDLRGARFMAMASYRYHQRGEPKPSKNEANIVGIGSSWLDLDTYATPEWRDVAPEEIREVILNAIEDLGLPTPSWIVFSGRGHQVVWQYPAQAWHLIGTRWKALQRTLHEKFLFLGSDPSGRTATKWFRLPQTKNEKSGLQVSFAWPHSLAEIQRTTFDTLAAAVLPHARQSKDAKAKAKADRIAKAAARAARPRREGQHGAKLGWRSYWGTLRGDLEKLFALRHGTGPVPDGGGRNAWIKALAYAAAWDMPASDLEGYVRSEAARCGLSEAEALAKTVTIRKRAKDAAEGIRVLYRGRKVDPRYRPAPRTFCEDLSITTMEMRKADLRMLVDSTRRKANAVGRVITARRLAGVTGRDVQQATRLAVGKAAIDMRDLGLTNAEIRDVFDLPTQRYLDTCLRDARAVAAISAVTPKPKAKRAPKPVPAPEPVVESVTVDAEPEEVSRAHEVLRGTRETAVIGDGVVVARINRSYDLNVTTVGTYLPRARTPAESPPARRASSRLVEA
ncbi:hypothetical protein ASF60_21805 [Methylobacterium sp. Leaf113]|uniref:hypothetical protein n=1 Tax=Methylobacterium sp. Leaf113 TaxID=1736259 RepID=UPI0006F7525C|nr:hypothetical protein [Methylobacterium sp. Leaf113]KQP85327.1 hypothetical protein ASF60_21805 [Methylobacterium sp. Leaf113]